jgi:hypothetical protein
MSLLVATLVIDKLKTYKATKNEGHISIRILTNISYSRSHCIISYQSVNGSLQFTTVDVLRDIT